MLYDCMLHTERFPLFPIHLLLSQRLSHLRWLGNLPSFQVWQDRAVCCPFCNGGHVILYHTLMGNPGVTEGGRHNIAQTATTVLAADHDYIHLFRNEQARHVAVI